MEHYHTAAQCRITVQVCANVARIAGEALAYWQSETRRKIAVHESTKLPGWEYLVHKLQADESVVSTWLVDVNKGIKYAMENEATEAAHGAGFP